MTTNNPSFASCCFQNKFKTSNSSFADMINQEKEILLDLQNLPSLLSDLLDFDDHTDFAPKLGPTFKTDFSRPQTSLIDKKNKTTLLK